jgi:hypothetical protein
MAAAAGIILGLAGIFVPVGIDVAKAKADARESTSVQIFTGGGHDSIGGSAPHIALWDDNGNRIGQYHAGGLGDVIDQRKDRVVEIVHSQTTPQYNDVDPYYVMVSNLEDNAICIAAVAVSARRVSGVWFGDVGYQCGQSWFLSNYKFDSTFAKPKCVWLDANHDNGINARALSFHLNDMAPQPDKLAQYNARPETLCNSTPRFSFWGNLLPDGVIPFFNPPLEYLPNEGGGGEGADKDPERVIDKPNQFNKGVYLNQGESRKTRRRDVRARSVQRRSNPDKSRLIITDWPGHSAREICESETSFGWDTVSTVEGLFCDMESKQLYPLCDATISTNCFDLDAEELKTIVKRDGVLVPVSSGYNKTSHWKD